MVGSLSSPMATSSPHTSRPIGFAESPHFPQGLDALYQTNFADIDLLQALFDEAAARISIVIGEPAPHVIAQWPGISAEQIEQQVAIPLETVMNGIPGIAHVRSWSIFGLSTVEMVFGEETTNFEVHIHINAGRSDAFFADLKANVIPLFEAEKSAGLIVSYRFFTSEQTNGSDDWNFGYAVVFANMAALDGLPDKAYDLRMKHYGDQTTEQKVLDKRYENAHLVSSFLIRDVTLR